MTLVTRQDDAPDGADRLSWLLGQLAVDDPDPALAREAHGLVRAAILPRCIQILGSREAALDAEQEVWRQLLEHLRRHPPTSGSWIVHGVAYVRKIAERTCYDAIRRAGIRRDELDTDLADAGITPTDLTPRRRATDADRARSAMFDYRSARVLEDLSTLEPEDVNIVCLRLQGHSYAEIARLLGGTLSPGTAQTNGQRAFHCLRGRIHVLTWSQEPLGGWSVPACPELRPLKAEAQRVLLAGGEPTLTLCRSIGKHLDPQPNRSRVRGDDPVCRYCVPERQRSEARYFWMLGTIPPLLGLGAAVRFAPAPTPAPDPTGYATPAAPPPVSSVAPPAAPRPPASIGSGQVPARGWTAGPAVAGGASPRREAAPGPRGRRSGRTRILISALVVLALLLLTTGVVVAVQGARRDGRAAPAALPGGQPSPGSRGPGGPGPSTAGTTPSAGTVPEVCSLVTAADVTSILGGDAFRECNPGATPPAGGTRTSTTGNFDRSTVESHGVREFAGFVLSRVESPPGGATLSDCGSIGRTATGLGDANCYTSTSSGVAVNVQKGHLYLKVVCGLVNGSRYEGAVLRLVRLLVDKLPDR